MAILDRAGYNEHQANLLTEMLTLGPGGFDGEKFARLMRQQYPKVRQQVVNELRLRGLDPPEWALNTMERVDGQLRCIGAQPLWYEEDIDLLAEHCKENEHFTGTAMHRMRVGLTWQQEANLLKEQTPDEDGTYNARAIDH